MKENRLEISPSCHLVYTEYAPGIIDVEIEYTEHSPDAWYSDSATCIDLDEKKAKEIIDFLTNAYHL